MTAVPAPGRGAILYISVDVYISARCTDSGQQTLGASGRCGARMIGRAVGKVLLEVYPELDYDWENE